MSNEQPSAPSPAPHIGLVFGSKQPSERLLLLMRELEKEGWRVTLTSLMKQREQLEEANSALWREIRTGLSELAQALTHNLTGRIELPDWLRGELADALKGVDAVVCIHPKVARLVLPAVDAFCPGALRIGIEGTYKSGEDWNGILLDDFIAPHLAIGDQVQGVRDGLTRFHVGGPIAQGSQLEKRRLDSAEHTLTVSFHGIDEGDIDPLLFQLTMIQELDTAFLFLRSNSESIDELVRLKAMQYGLRAKRPRSSGGNEAWIAGSSLLVGRPSHDEMAQASQWKIPTVLFGNGGTLSAGHRFLVEHGASLESKLPVTFSVDIESALPGGSNHQPMSDALEQLEGTGMAGIMKSLKAALESGRPTQSPVAAVQGSDELEDIGVPDTGTSIPKVMGADTRRSYLSEIILRQNQLDSQLQKAKTGIELWGRRVKLAQDAGRSDLLAASEQRLQGIERVANSLMNQRARLMGLRDRLTSNESLTATDRHSLAQLLGPRMPQTLIRDEGDAAMFSKLEIDDALIRLKNKLDDLS